MFKPNTKYQIKTSKGFQDFKGIQVLKKSSKITLSTPESSLSCAPNHQVQTFYGWKKAQDLTVHDAVYTPSIFQPITSLQVQEGEFEYYDVVGVESEEYYTNGILSHNCQFVGSENTLISPYKLQCLAFEPPIQSVSDTKHGFVEGLDIYEKVQKGHMYVICVDTSRGMSEDYHAFVVIDVTGFPNKLVAKYRNNKLSPQMLPEIIAKVGLNYNGAHVLVEISDNGQQVADLLHDDLEYPNMLLVSAHGKKGQKIDGGFGGAGRKTQTGVKTSNPIKLTGAAILKQWIESDKLVITDFHVIEELSTYVQKGAGYEATEGYHDDLCAALVIFGWLTTQPYYQDIVNVDIRRKLFSEKMTALEEDLAPFGFIDNGLENDLDELQKELAREQAAGITPAELERLKNAENDDGW